MDAPRLPLLAVVGACTLVLAGCLVPSVPWPNRPADPEIWVEQVQLDDGTRVRLGGYLAGEQIRPLVEWQRPGDPGFTRRAFEALGAAGHTRFDGVLGDEAGLVLVSAAEGRESLVVTRLDWAGESRGAVEVALGAPMRGYELGVAWSAGQLVVGLALGLPDGGVGAEAAVLWLGPAGEPVRGVVVPELSGFAELALHGDGALTVLGAARLEGSPEVGVARFSPAGALEWARSLRFPDYGARSLLGASLAVGPAGQALVVGQHPYPLRPRVDVVLAQLDAAGALTWQRAISRPYPAEPPNWVLGPITQRAAFAPDGALFLAATAPFEQQGGTHLVLLELGAGGEVLRQSAVTRGTQRLVEVRAAADTVRARGELFFECTFDRGSFAGCEAPLALPPLVSEPTAVDLRERPMAPRTLAPAHVPVSVTPWTPPG